MKTTRYHHLIVALACFALASTATAAVLFQDDFNGLGTDPLNGTTPDVTQGSTTWVANAEYKADGAATVSGNPVRRAYLTLGGLIDDNRGNADAIYTLSATLNVTSGTSGIWEAVGFWNEDAPVNNFGSTPSSGTAWMLRRDNAQLRAFLGTRTNGSLAMSSASPNNVAGTLDVQVVLDLTSWNGTSSYGDVTYFAKLSSDSTYTELAAGDLGATNSTFRSVGLGGGGTIAAQFSSFELSQVPEPSSLVLLALGGVFLASRRRK